MEKGFNFSDYYKEMIAKTEVPLNYAGLDLDQATELSEWITDNVVYYVSHIWADGKTYDGNYRLMIVVTDPEDPDEKQTYYVRQWHSVDDAVEAEVVGEWEPGRERNGLIELEQYGENDGVSYYILTDHNLDVSDVEEVTTKEEVHEVKLSVFPKYEAITGDHTTRMWDRFKADFSGDDPGLKTTVNQNVIGLDDNWGSSAGSGYPITPNKNLATYMRCMYGLLGLYGGTIFVDDRSKSLAWMFGSKYGMARTSSNAVVSQRRFNKWLRRLSDHCADHNIGVKVDLYDTDYANEITAVDATKAEYKRNKKAAKAKHKAYLKAARKADWTRTGMNRRTSFNSAYGKHLPKFLNKFGRGAEGEADFVTLNAYKDGQTQDAVIPTMREVFRAWYYDAGELEDELNDNFQTVYDEMSKVPLGWRTVSSSVKESLFKIAGKYKSFPTTVTEEDANQVDVEVPASERVLIDLSYILNEMDMNKYNLGITSGSRSGDTDFKYNYYPRIVQRAGYELTDEDEIDASGFSKSYWCVDEYTTGSFDVKRDDDTLKYSWVQGKPTVVHTPVHDAKSKGSSDLWKWTSSYRYSVKITDCYVDSDGKKHGSSDYRTQGAPEDIKRTRAANVGASAEEVMDELTNNYNYMLASNSKFSEISVSTSDYVLNADKTNIELSDIDYGDSDVDDMSDDEKRNLVIANYRTYMFYTACMLNYFAENKFTKDSADQFWKHMGSYGSLEEYIEAIRGIGYRIQPEFGVKLFADGTVDTSTTYTYDLVTWDTCFTTEKRVARATVVYEESWRVPTEGFESVGPLVDSVEVMYDAYRQMIRKLPTTFLRFGVRTVWRTLKRLYSIADDIVDLLRTVYRLRVYQMFAQESPFANKSMIGMKGMNHAFKGKIAAALTADDPFVAYSSYAPMWCMPGRLMIPVRAYKKVRKRCKRWGRTRTRTVKVPIGVRWAEVQFIDTTVLQSYPQVDVGPGKDVAIGGNVTVSRSGTGYLYTFDSELSEEVLDASSVTIYTAAVGTEKVDCECDGLVSTSGTTLSGSTAPGVGKYYVPKVRVPLPKSKQDDTKYAITMKYRMPHLPYDSELRKKAFIDYGPLSQDKNFQITRNGDGGYGVQGEVRRDGWTIFHESSNSIRDLRCGTTTLDSFDYDTEVHATTKVCGSLGIHEKVAVLLRVLREEFGNDKVRLVETYRSIDDQAAMCLGSEESSFLSWHNYGLAVKIVVYEDDLSTPADLYGDEFKRMIPIAKAFTEACLNGSIGEPCNVVWCRRLMVGPSLFDWEFLPIGVGHKDAPKFREDTVNLLDPMAERSYIDVDSNGYVKQWAKLDPTYEQPYVLAGSNAYRNAQVCGGRHYVEPSKIRNLSHADDIVLYDAKEYVNLIQLKMDSHGTDLMNGMDMFAWRSLNPISAAQLIRYFSMTGNLAGAKAILAGSYYDRYNYICSMYYASDPVLYVQKMLGNRYDDVRITVDKDGDSSYITLKDGLLHITARDAYPDMPSSDGDRFKSKQATPARMKYGNWYDGKFYTYDERPIQEIISDEPVINGYKRRDGEWKPVDDDAVAVHTIIASQIKKEYDAVCKMFKDYKGVLMYDRYEDSPRYEMADMLENEFGVIAAQDLIDFDDLLDDLAKDEVEAVNPGAFDGDIYEKVVNNAEVAGMKRATMTREHIHINDRHPGMTVEDLYRRMTERGYTANTLLK